MFYTEKYKCPSCGEEIRSERLGFAVHNHYVKEIAEKFLHKGCLVIQEATIPSIPEDWYDPNLEKIPQAFVSRNWRNVIRKWKEPDLIVLKYDRMISVIEVLGTAEDYRILAAKVVKINRFLMPRQIIVFDPIHFVDRYLEEKRRRKLGKILGFQPRTYKQVDKHYQKMLRKKHNLKFTFWFEEDLNP